MQVLSLDPSAAGFSEMLVTTYQFKCQKSWYFIPSPSVGFVELSVTPLMSILQLVMVSFL